VSIQTPVSAVSNSKLPDVKIPIAFCSGLVNRLPDPFAEAPQAILHHRPLLKTRRTEELEVLLAENL